MRNGNKLLLFYEINSGGKANIRMRSWHALSVEVGKKSILTKGTSSWESLSTVCHVAPPAYREQ
jgi:hypothetical protein